MKKGYKRSARVGELLRQELSDLLRREVKDPRVQGATVTDVAVSDDLSRARVYYNTSLCGHSRQEVHQALESASGFLRSQLRDRMNLRQPPQLSFHYDESFDEGARMDVVLAGVTREGGKGRG